MNLICEVSVQVLLDERRESSLQASSSGLEHATTSNLLTRKKTLSPPKLLKPVEVVRTITDQPQVNQSNLCSLFALFSNGH